MAQVKARANMEGKTVAAITADLQKLGKQAFIEECWTERLREFPLEFKIWDDCLRTGKFPVISSTEKGKVTYVDLVGAKNASGATFKSSDLLWPISLNEMQRNPSLTQNEGYAVGLVVLLFTFNYENKRARNDILDSAKLEGRLEGEEKRMIF